MANQSRRMWLHNENNTINILPYTSLDNIKMRSDNLSQDFETDYNNTKNTITNNKNNADAAISSLNNRVSALENQSSQGSIDLATPSKNGLMSKEDKTKLNNIATNANNYTLPIASSSQLGGVKIDGSTTTIDSDGTLHAIGGSGGSISNLSDVDLDSPLNGQIIQYDYENEKWVNADPPSGSGAGASSILELTDVLINSLTNNQILQYNASINKWENKNSAFNLNYITEEQIDSLFASPTPVFEIAPFSTATDQQFTDIINKYYAGELTLEQIQAVWHVGDSRIINLAAMEATPAISDSHRQQDVELIILDFEHDDLAYENKKSLITVQIKNLLKDADVSDEESNTINNTENGYMNSTDTNTGGWEDSNRREWCQTVFYNALPSYIQSLVATVKKPVIVYDSSDGETISTVNDTIFLLSGAEVVNSSNAKYYHAYSLTSEETEGTRYAYYEQNETACFKKPTILIREYVHSYWLLRTPTYMNTNRTGNGSDFEIAHYSVSADHSSAGFSGIMQASANDLYGIAPAFCM